MSLSRSEQEEAAKIAAGCAAVIAFPFIMLGVIAFTVGISAWEAFVLVNMWHWFVNPTFSTVALTFPVSFGIVLMLEMLFDKSRLTRPTEQTINWSGFVDRVLSPAIVLGAGYLVYTYLM